MASLLGELRRRNVVKVAVAYAIVGWLLVQIADVFFPALQLPDWTVTLVAALVILGLPVALLLSWAYELTPEGVKRTESVPVSESITRLTGRKLDFVIIGLLALGVVFLLVDRYVLEEDAAPLANVQDRRSIAVLPLTNQSAGGENSEFFAAGMHDQLLTQLAKIGSLKVISRTSVMEYAATTKNLREIGLELGVATILEGSVQQAGDMVVMNAQLIDAETDEHLWAETYSREFTAENIFAIQRETATAIAAALQATILPEEAARLNEVPTLSRRAFDYYLTGNEYLNNTDPTTYAPMAVERYSLAVQEDPDFALAWAALARANSIVYLYAVDRSDSRREMARDAVDRAFEIAPDLPEAHLAFGDYYFLGFRDYERALAQYALAEEGLSGSPGLYEALAFVYRRMGRFEESAENMEHAIELDPRNLRLIIQQGFTYRALQRYREAEAFFDRVLEIAPDDPLAHRHKAELPIFRDSDPGPARLAAAGDQNVTDRQYLGWLAAVWEEDYATAIRYLDAWDQAFSIDQFRYIPIATFYGWTYLHDEQPERAAEHFMQAREQLAPILATTPGDARLHNAQAMILAGLGDYEAAAREARRAMELSPRSVDALAGLAIHQEAILYVFALIGDADTLAAEIDAFFEHPNDWSIEAFADHPSLRAFRDDPRFQALIAKYGGR